jgi:cAMP-dependent protein kinase regulator
VQRCSVSAESDTNAASFVKTVVPKTMDQKIAIEGELNKCFLFQNMDYQQRSSIIDAMTERKAVAGEYIIRQGESGDFLYIIASGEFDVLKHGADNVDNKVFAYKDAGMFGELALMYNCPRAATVRATTAGQLWALDRVSFRHLLVDYNSRQRALYEDFLQRVPLLAGLSQTERAYVADCLLPKTFDDGEYVIRQGDVEEMPCFYFIEEGAARATQSRPDSDTEVEVKAYAAGDYFGERALITNEPRAANVIAVGELRVAMMDRASFERVLGDCQDVMKRNLQLYGNAQ